MITNVLTSKPAFFANDFRSDLKYIESLKPELVTIIVDWFKTAESIEFVIRRNNWINILQKTGLSIEEIERIIKPNYWITTACYDNQVNIDDFILDLKEAGILHDSLASSVFMEKLKNLAQALYSLLSQKKSRKAPTLPLRYLRDITTRCIFISEFQRDFDFDSVKSSEFTPQLKALHPAITFQLAFDDIDHEDIGIIMDRNQITKLKKTIEHAEIELINAEKILPNEYLLSIE
jgi:hypothetical protein